MPHGTQRPAAAQCEILFELFSGSSLVALGRLLRGHDAGRLVTLRRVTGKEAELAAMVDISRSLAHPSLAKVLGIARAHGDSYLASEYVLGLSLFELRQSVTLRARQFPADAAVRVIVDALKAVTVAQGLMRDVTGVHVDRLLFAEHVWIAEYGETLLGEVGLAAQLVASSDDTPLDDVRSAAAELGALLTGRPPGDAWHGDDAVPPALAALLARASGADAQRFRDVPSFLNALIESQGGALASDERVSEALRLTVGELLDTRRGKLDLVERASAQRDADESTQFFRAAEFAMLQERDTARPPPDATPESEPEPQRGLERAPGVQATAPPIAVAANARPEEDEATQFWQRLGPESGPDAAAERAAVTVVTRSRSPAASSSLRPNASTPPVSEGSALDDDLVLASFRPSGASRWLFLLGCVLLLLAAWVLQAER